MDFLKFIEEGIPYYHNDWDLNFLLRNCAYLEADEKQEIIKAFHFAKDAHEGAYREGGSAFRGRRRIPKKERGKNERDHQ